MWRTSSRQSKLLWQPHHLHQLCLHLRWHHHQLEGDAEGEENYFRMQHRREEVELPLLRVRPTEANVLPVLHQEMFSMGMATLKMTLFKAIVA